MSRVSDAGNNVPFLPDQADRLNQSKPRNDAAQSLSDEVDRLDQAKEAEGTEEVFGQYTVKKGDFDGDGDVDKLVTETGDFNHDGVDDTRYYLVDPNSDDDTEGTIYTDYDSDGSVDAISSKRDFDGDGDLDYAELKKIGDEWHISLDMDDDGAWELPLTAIDDQMAADILSGEFEGIDGNGVIGKPVAKVLGGLIGMLVGNGVLSPKDGAEAAGEIIARTAEKADTEGAAALLASAAAAHLKARDVPEDTSAFCREALEPLLKKDPALACDVAVGVYGRLLENWSADQLS